MSSATRFDPDAVRSMLGAISEKLLNNGRAETAAEAQRKLSRLGMNERQQELNNLWAWYRLENYSTRKADWNGDEVLSPIAHEAIATQGFIPGGFYDAGAGLPMKFRRPSAPTGLVRMIVNRFSDMLFSERHHPQVKVAGDADTEQWLAAVCKAGRLWAKMLHVRNYGGATGTGIVGFKFLHGRPVFEIFDPRWVSPTFSDRANFRLKQLEVRYMFVVEERSPTGDWQQQWYWYRRVIDDATDTLFVPVAVGDGEEPQWVEDTVVKHGLGFCPIVWVQNMPLLDSIDGDCDAQGAHDSIAEMDELIAEANKGTKGNCDPTLVITSDSTMSDVSKGSDNAIKVEKGGSANYLELQGSGPKAAIDQAEKIRKNVLELVNCVLSFDAEGGNAPMTATEVERRHAPFLSKCDVFREQWGETCLVPLFEMLVEAGRKLGAPRRTVDEATGVDRIERSKIALPMRKVMNERGGFEGFEEQRLGPGGVVELQWPRYFEPTLQDVQTATTAVAAAKAQGLIDTEHAVRFAAPFYHVEDPMAMIDSVEQEQAQRAEQAQANMLGSVRALGAGDDASEQESAALGAAPQSVAETALNGAQVASLVDVVKDVVVGAIPRETAINIIMRSFNMSYDDAEQLLGPAGESFVPSVSGDNT